MDKPTGVYLFKFNNGNTKTMFEICYQLIIRALEEVIDVFLVSLLISGVFIVNLKQISHIVLVLPLLTLIN